MKLTFEGNHDRGLELGSPLNLYVGSHRGGGGGKTIVGMRSEVQTTWTCFIHSPRSGSRMMPVVCPLSGLPVPLDSSNKR